MAPCQLYKTNLLIAVHKLEQTIFMYFLTDNGERMYLSRAKVGECATASAGRELRVHGGKTEMPNRLLWLYLRRHYYSGRCPKRAHAHKAGTRAKSSWGERAPFGSMAIMHAWSVQAKILKAINSQTINIRKQNTIIQLPPKCPINTPVRNDACIIYQRSVQ